MSDKTILLVEDNPDDEMLTLMALKKNSVNNKIIVARDGQEALDYLFATGKFEGRNLDEVPQVILLDLKLPKVDGLEVLSRIRANSRTKNLPVVILTSSREQSDLMSGYSNGANSYVVKPVDINEFRQAVKSLGLYWLLLNESPPAR